MVILLQRLLTSILSRSPDNIFNINTSLLGTTDIRPWSNLGLWESSNLTFDYHEAAKLLAKKHGMVANIQPNTNVLELACGYGAGLQLWQDEFHINTSSGIDIRATCINHISQHSPTKLKNLEQGRFDRPLPTATASTSYDTVLCIDAIYHSHSLASVLHNVSQVTKPTGVFCFSTILLPERTMLSIAQKTVLKIARINPCSLMTPSEFVSYLNREDWECTHIEYLDNAVWLGFYQGMRQRQNQLTKHQKHSLDWLKIKTTALCCQYIAKKLHWHYAIVLSTKN